MTDNTSNQLEHSLSLHSHLFYNLLILATGLIVVVGVPPFILDAAAAKDIFNNGMGTQVVYGLTIVLALICLVMMWVYWLATLLLQRNVGAIFVVFTFNWIALTGFLLPLTDADGTLPFFRASTDFVNLILVIIVSALLTLAWFSKHTKTIAISMAAFVLIAVLPTIPPMFSSFSKTQTQNQIKLSNESNIILMSFDGVPGHSVKDALLNSPKTANAFKDFTFYENAASSAPSTYSSQLGVVHGNYDFTNWHNDHPVDWRNLYFNDTERYDFTTAYSFNFYNKAGAQFNDVKKDPNAQYRKLFYLYRSVALRLASNIGTRTADKLQQSLFPQTQIHFSRAVENYDAIIDMFTDGNSKTSVVYMHFGFTHYPVILDEKCDLVGRDQVYQIQNEQGLENLGQCALKKYAEFTDKLKSIGVYDNTLIILVSDHGKPVWYYDTSPHNLQINGNKEFGFDRYRPLMMIKAPGQRQDAITYSEKIVLIDDIAQTTCYATINDSSCESAPGVNLLDENDTPSSDFYIHVMPDETTTFSVRKQKAVRISREIPLEQAIRENGDIALSEFDHETMKSPHSRRNSSD
jgi:hypothetical protein